MTKLTGTVLALALLALLGGIQRPSAGRIFQTLAPELPPFAEPLSVARLSG